MCCCALTDWCVVADRAQEEAEEEEEEEEEDDEYEPGKVFSYEMWFLWREIFRNPIYQLFCNGASVLYFYKLPGVL